MKFVLFVEGETERRALPSFLKRWLDPRLGQRVRIDAFDLRGWPSYQKHICRKVELHLAGTSGREVIGVIGLLDLYGPTFYPPDKKTADDRYSWAKARVERQVNNRRFSQHFAVHELEAWLLAGSEGLPVAVRRALGAKSANPETVNFDEPPAKLLERLYLDKTKQHYKKVIDGVCLFAELDPDLARDKCPRLKALLDEMLRMAHDAGL
jgi:hypothetical protein